MSRAGLLALCEMNPTLSFNEIVARELKAAGVAPEAVRVAGGPPQAVKASAA